MSLRLSSGSGLLNEVEVCMLSMWRKMGRRAQVNRRKSFYFQQEERRQANEGLLQVQDGFGIRSDSGGFSW